MYSGEDADGFLKTFYVDSAYRITFVDEVEFDTTQASYCRVAQLDDENHYLFVYVDSGNDVWAETVEIEDLS